MFKCLFRFRSKKTSKVHVTGLCEGNSPVTGEFPTQRASNAENVSIWWGHHDPTGTKILHIPLPWWCHECKGITKHGSLTLLNNLFRVRKKLSKVRITGSLWGNCPVTGGFPTQRASNAECVSILWHQHVSKLELIKDIPILALTD